MVDPTKLPSLDSLQETKSPGASTMDLVEYVIEAKRIDDQEFEEKPTDQYFPTKIWHFTRFLKGHAELEHLDADEALARVCEVLSYRYPDQDPLSDVLGLTEDEEIQFLTTWDKVVYPTNCTLLDEALERAKKCPLTPDRCKKGRKPKYQEFVSLAGHLQALRGDTNILLPCEKVGSLIERDKGMISRYRQLAVEDGYLTEMKPHRSPGTGTGSGKATEFRFTVDRFPELQREKTPDAPNFSFRERGW